MAKCMYVLPFLHKEKDLLYLREIQVHGVVEEYNYICSLQKGKFFHV